MPKVVLTKLTKLKPANTCVSNMTIKLKTIRAAAKTLAESAGVKLNRRTRESDVAKLAREHGAFFERDAWHFPTVDAKRQFERECSERFTK